MEDVLILFSDYTYCDAQQRQETTRFFFHDCVVSVMDIFYCGVNPHFLRDTQVSLEMYGDSPHDVLSKNREHAMAECSDWEKKHLPQIDNRTRDIAVTFYKNRKAWSYTAENVSIL